MRATRVPFLVAAGLAICNVTYGLLVLPESLPPELRRPFNWRRANPLGSLRVLAGSLQILGRLADCLELRLVRTGRAADQLRRIANQIRFGWTTQENGLALALAGLGSAVVQGLLVRKIIPLLGERRAAFVGSVLAMTAYLLIALAPYGWVVLLGIVVQASGSFTGPAVQGMVSASVGPDRQGETQGALASVQGLTAIVAPLFAGLVFSLFAAPTAAVMLPGAPFLVSALAYGVALWAIAGVVLPKALAEAEAVPAGKVGD